MVWTRCMDMRSGGGLKEKPYSNIYIEAAESEARVVFYNRFGHSTERVSCTCCGEDYSLTESETLAEVTEFEREWVSGYGKGRCMPLEEYLAREDVLVIRAEDIKPAERVGDVPEQGFVWRD